MNVQYWYLCCRRSWHKFRKYMGCPNTSPDYRMLHRSMGMDSRMFRQFWNIQIKFGIYLNNCIFHHIWNKHS